MKINKKLIAPVLTLAGLIAMGAGTTYALFTSGATNDVTIQAGKVKIGSTLSDLKLYSGENVTGDPSTDTIVDVTANGQFTNGGTATIDGNSIVLSKVTPGDKVTFKVTITNYSNVISKYRTIAKVTQDNGLLAGLKLKLGDDDWNGITKYSAWHTTPATDSSVIVEETTVTIDLPTDRGNEYTEKTFKLDFIVDAVQGNAVTTDAPTNKTVLYTGSDAYTYANIVNATATLSEELKNVELGDNIDLSNYEWPGIAAYYKGIDFDGNDYTISNMTTAFAHDIGFFQNGCTCTIHDVTFDNATVCGIGRVAVVSGHGICTTVDNVTVKNSSVEAVVTDNDDGDKAGAIVGYLTAQNTASVTNCTVTNTTVKGLRDIGGLVGYADGPYVVTGNTLTNVNIINNRIDDYKNYDTDAEYDVNEIIGEQGASGTFTGNTATNVTFSTVLADGLIYNNSLDRYEIYNGNGLKTFATLNNAGSILDNRTTLLTDDIDMSEITDYVGIGISHRFHGVFNGQGHTIKNLTYNTGLAYGGGLFADILGGSEIKNFTLDNVHINSNLFNDAGRIKGNVYGIVAGYAYGEMLFENISVKNSSVYAYGKVGGILGMAADPGSHTTTVKNCTLDATTTVKGVYNVGGLVGTLLNNGNFSGNTINCVLDATIPTVDTNWTGTEELTYHGITSTYCVSYSGGVLDGANVQKATVCVNYYDGSIGGEVQVDTQGTVTKDCFA